MGVRLSKAPVPVGLKEGLVDVLGRARDTGTPPPPLHTVPDLLHCGPYQLEALGPCCTCPKLACRRPTVTITTALLVSLHRELLCSVQQWVDFLLPYKACMVDMLTSTPKPTAHQGIWLVVLIVMLGRLCLTVQEHEMQAMHAAYYDYALKIEDFNKLLSLEKRTFSGS